MHAHLYCAYVDRVMCMHNLFCVKYFEVWWKMCEDHVCMIRVHLRIVLDCPMYVLLRAVHEICVVLWPLHEKE